MTFFGLWTVSRCDTIVSVKGACTIRLAHFVLLLLTWDRHTPFACWSQKRVKDTQSRTRWSQFSLMALALPANHPPNLGYECVHLRSAKPQIQNLRDIMLNDYFNDWVLEVIYTAMVNWHSDNMISQIKNSSCRN